MWAFSPRGERERTTKDGMRVRKALLIKMNERLSGPLCGRGHRGSPRLLLLALGTQSSGCKERSRRSPAHEPSASPRPPRCRYSIIYFLFAHLSHITQTAGQHHWHQHWISIFSVDFISVTRAFVSELCRVPLRWFQKWMSVKSSYYINIDIVTFPFTQFNSPCFSQVCISTTFILANTPNHNIYVQVLQCT